MIRASVVNKYVMLLIFMALGALAQPRPALFLGLMNDKGEPVQSEMEQALRNAFAANQNIKLTDKLETHRIVREKERLGRSNMENFIPPSVKLDSSTVIIKGVVQEPVFNLRRHWLLWGRIDAQVSVKFYFEEISGAANYQGEFSASAMRKKDLLLFASPRKNVHISAADRAELLGEMQSKILKEVSELASTFFNALTVDEVDTVHTAESDAVDTSDVADTANSVNEPEPADSSEVKSDKSAE